MRRELDKLRNVPSTLDAHDAEQLSVPLASPMQQFGKLFTFRYSFTEIFTQDGDLHVRMKETRYQDGKLTSEECEGTLDGRAYDRMVEEAQTYFLNQTAGFMRMLVTPFFSSPKDGRD